MPNIALVLCYKGTAYHGWQSQKNACAVQDAVEKAILKCTGQSVRLFGCGRTDAGVHAGIYLANYFADEIIPCARLPFALNCALNQDIRILDAFICGDDFNARFSCLKKQYTYSIYDKKISSPFYSDFSMFYPRGADENAMEHAAKSFIGTHDFAAVRSLGTAVRSTVRTVYQCDVLREGGFVKIRITADGFLYNMARTIAGTLIAVSEGRLCADDIGKLLISGRREQAGDTCPAHGLCLTKLSYDDFELESCDIPWL